MMGSAVEENNKTGGLTDGSESSLLEEMKLLREMQEHSGSRKAINSELWHACAGPLVSLPQVGSIVYYFPQGHIEQVAVSTKTSATSQIPNYPNLPPQLTCQVHNVTLHADKDTDEIYAQMSLQPVSSEKDVVSVPNCGIMPNKHPAEYFCKVLTASDTSTHGGFSVPRRAAEKLFPSLDYTLQPPMQELVVRDLHENTWTFRHIYRGQPKRHLLTTGWSLFVGSKRLKAGDSVLFVRDEKSQLLVGVRHANRPETSLPSSVLSTDSMHIGVLAAAAHAAANRSPFTVFYNPRACPSEFVIPLSKYRKALYGIQLSAGMRFGMMFETDESGKRRYMGTIASISDLDPLRWPSSKWHNIQVEWDEPDRNGKPERVNAWDIETPEDVFIFPSLTSSLKRPLHPGIFGVNTEWESLLKRPLIQVSENGTGNLPCSVSNLFSEQLKPQHFNHPVIFAPAFQQISPKESTLEKVKMHDKSQPVQFESQLVGNQNGLQLAKERHNAMNSSFTKMYGIGNMPPLNKLESKTQTGKDNENLKQEQEHSITSLSRLTTNSESNEQNFVMNSVNSQTSMSQPAFHDQHQSPWQSQPNLLPMQLHCPQADASGLNGFLTCLNTGEWTSNLFPSQTCPGMYGSRGPLSTFGSQDSPEAINPYLMNASQNIWNNQLNHSMPLPQADQLPSLPYQDPCTLNSGALKDLSSDSNNQSGIYVDISNAASTVVDPSVSSAALDDYSTLKDADFQNPSDCLVSNFSSGQDVQSQITSVSLADSQAFSRLDSSGGTSSSNVEFESGLLHNSSWRQVAPRVRTYTKVQKAGSVGRSIDVTSFKNYGELISAIESMFGLKGLLNDFRGSGWKLVYVDYENDVLLLGDDPWEEFIGCVRCIRILSPKEVQRMSEEGMKLLNSATVQGIKVPFSGGGHS